MTRITTINVDLQRLERRGNIAATVIKLMMACNDLQLANEALDKWKKEQPRLRKGREVGAKMYFVRLQISHLYEALKIVEQIHTDESLLRLVKQCDQRTQNWFHELEPFLPNGSRRQWFESMVGKLRHNLVFHYSQSDKMIERAISDRAGRPEARYSLVTRGSTYNLWHFKTADDIVDSIVVRQIWGIPRDKDLRTEADRIAEEIRQVLLCFVDFAGDFIWKCFERS